ncbi:MAG: hypothetical protein WBD27_19510 [Pyrinomonadaceae bacterium]
MFGFLRRPTTDAAELLEELRSTSSALRELAGAMSESPQGSSQALEALGARVASLETTVAKTLAEAEALVIKAESLKSAARAAEERVRYANKAAAAPVGAETGDLELTDEQIAEAYAAAGVHPGDVTGGSEQRVQTLSDRLAGRRALTRELSSRKFR